MQLYKKSILIIIIVFSSVNLFAQSNKKVSKKVDKKAEASLAAAIKMRIDNDEVHARAVRDRYNKSSWLGGRVADLIASWGAPSRSVSDEAGGKIIVYETTHSGTSGSYTPSYMSWNEWGEVTDYRPATDTRSAYSYTEYTEIFVNQNGVITNLKWGTR